jgi:predicted TIM-barrel fold metal-dependent hydrolase
MLLIPDGKTELTEVLHRHPRLRITIDHMGIRGNNAGPAILPYIEETLKLAQFPNVNVKLSNMPSFSIEKFPYADLNPVVERLVKAFGAQRCFWGTDLSRMLGKYGVGYREAIDHVLHHMPFLSEQDKEWIMGRGLCEWLRWPA